MKLLKFALFLLFTLNVAFAGDSMKLLSIPYSFKTLERIEETDANFIAYIVDLKSDSSFQALLDSILDSAKDDNALAEFISNAGDVELAKKFLAELAKEGESSIKLSYVLKDGDNFVLILNDKFILLNKELKWEASKESALYSYLAKNAKDAKDLSEGKEIEKDNSLIELFCEEYDVLDTSSSKVALETSEAFFYYENLYDAFFCKDFSRFSEFLDEESRYSYDAKIGDASSSDEIAKILADELKEERVYRNIADLGSISLVFFCSYPNGKKEGEKAILSFGIFRDIGCGVEIVNYAIEPDPVLMELISR